MEEPGGGWVADAMTARAWLEVDLAALRRNAVSLRDQLRRGTRLLPMVKADAYGLGATRVVAALVEERPWGYGVATVEEGAELRRAGIDGRIVVFTPCAAVDASRLVAWRLEPVVTSLEALREYEAAVVGEGGRIPIHLEIDTGMGRFGLVAAEVAQWAPEVRRMLEAGGLELASTFTHLHSAESDRPATRQQWERFEAVLSRMREAGVEPGLRHVANSAALLRHPELHADLVRPGLFLYGGDPLVAPAPSLHEPRGRPPREQEDRREQGRAGGEARPEMQRAGGEDRSEMRRAGGVPEPVVRVRARVLDVREVPAGSTVSYGATYATDRPARLATLGIGYADGLPHALSNRGEALVAGRRVPFVGAVCMDMTVVDVTGVDGVRPGTAATLLGREGKEEIGLAALARQSGRIAYELLTGFSTRLPRVARPRPPETDDAATRRRKPGRSGAAHGGEEKERIDEHGLEREQPA